MKDEKGNANLKQGALQLCLKHWRVYMLTAAVAFLLAIITGVSIPKTYAAQVKVSDEHKETDLLLGLNTFQAWAKSTLDDHEGLRQPEVYKQLVETKEFAEEMAKVKLEGYDTDYYHHIEQNHRIPWWERWFDKHENEHERVVDIIQKSIRSKVVALYGTITLQVTDQDPVVAAMIVDSVRTHLQKHMADYARDRAWRDLMDAQNKMAAAEQKYQEARQQFANFEDTHQGITSPKAQSVEDQLMKEYELAFTEYGKTVTQYRRAKALVEKFSYTFAVVKNATVPVKPSAPFTPGYVMAYIFIAMVLTTWGVLGKRKMIIDN